MDILEEKYMKLEKENKTLKRILKDLEKNENKKSILELENSTLLEKNIYLSSQIKFINSIELLRIFVMRK